MMGAEDPGEQTLILLPGLRRRGQPAGLRAGLLTVLTKVQV